MRCLKRDVGTRAGGGEWREIQANRGMAALLMPRSVFRKVAQAELARQPDGPVDVATRIGYVVAELAKQLEVSKQAARIRLNTLKLVADPDAPSLPSLSGMVG